MIVHPEVGKWLIGLGELAFGMDPVGWRVPSVVVGSLMVLVHGPAGTAAHRLHAARLRRRPAAGPRRPALRAVPAGAARHLRGVLHALRGALPGGRPRAAPRPDGAPASTGRSAGGWGPVRGLLWRPWLAASGVMFGLAVGTKWTALYPLAAFGVLVWLWSAGRAAQLRGPPAGAPLGARRRRPGVRPPGRGRRSSSTSPPGPAGWCTPTSTSRRSRRRSTPATRAGRAGATASRWSG